MSLDPAILAFLATAPAPTVLPPGATPSERRDAIEADLGIMMATVPERETFEVDVVELTVPGPGRGIPIRVFTPRDRTEPLPALLYFFGGAWWMRSYNSPDMVNASRQIAAQANAVVVEIDYALAPENPYPAALNEGLAVLEWMAAGGAGHGIDGSRLAVGGLSSGGGLAASLALLARDEGGPEIRLQVLEVPALDLDRENLRVLPTGLTQADVAGFVEALEFYLPDGIPEGDVVASPLAAPSLEGLPPAFLAVAENDALRPAAEQYAERLRAAGVPVVSVVYGGAMHASPALSGISAGSHAWRAQVSWAVSTLHNLPGAVL